jgi:hypothetical protein
MSSETSTEAARLRTPRDHARGGPERVEGSGPVGPASSGRADRDQFQPWQLFTLAGLAAATAVVALVVFVWDGDRVTAILLSVVVGTAAFAGLAAYRAFAPLAGSEDAGIGSEMLAGRTRAALEREKTLALRTIKELEFDHSMGKLSEKDFTEMSARLRARAARIMRQLDQGAASYKDQIEKELARRTHVAPAAATRNCAACGAANDLDAAFCKKCGGKLES